jgi:hypothetical protein
MNGTRTPLATVPEGHLQTHQRTVANGVRVPFIIPWPVALTYPLQIHLMAGILEIREKSTLSSPVPLFPRIFIIEELQVTQNSSQFFHLRDPRIFCYNAIIRQIFRR